MGSLKLVGPAIKGTAKGTGVILNNVVGPTLTGAAKVITYKDILPSAFRAIGKGFDKAITKAGIPDSNLWKFSDFQSGVKSAFLEHWTKNIKIKIWW